MPAISLISEDEEGRKRRNEGSKDTKSRMANADTRFNTHVRSTRSRMRVRRETLSNIT